MLFVRPMQDYSGRETTKSASNLQVHLHVSFMKILSVGLAGVG